MDGAIDLSDPSFEPTDEQLVELAKRAFADVRSAHVRSLEKLRSDIREAREKVLAELESRMAGHRDPP